MKTYYKALDYLSAAMAASVSGNSLLAAKLFTAATSDPSMPKVQAMIERHNSSAFSAKASPVKTLAATLRSGAAKRISAADEEPVTDENLQEVEAEGADEWPFQASILDGVDDGFGVPMDQVNDQLRIEPEVNGPRAVQSGADEDPVITDEPSEDDEVFSEEFSEDPVDDGEGEVDLDEEEGEEAVSVARTSASAKPQALRQASAVNRLARAMANLQAAAKKKSKKASPKKQSKK